MDDLQAAVLQSVGAASMCWTDILSAGSFLDQRAKKIAEELCVAIQRITEAEWKARQAKPTGGGGAGSAAVGVGVDTKPWSTPA